MRMGVTRTTASPMLLQRNQATTTTRRRMRQASLIVTLAVCCLTSTATGKLADRSRIVQARQTAGKTAGRFHDNGRPIEGPSYRSQRADVEEQVAQRLEEDKEKTRPATQKTIHKRQQPSSETQVDGAHGGRHEGDVQMLRGKPEESLLDRKLSSQLSGCCYDYQSYSAEDLCYMYGQDCQSGETPSHDDGDSDCEHDGLSFIGISFSVSTDSGNPYSYQLCDQFFMENVIDRDYDYVMSMDEDGWLVGGGYKTFDYSGKMPYIDSSHTELLRIGNLDPNSGGTSIGQVYSAMESISFPPLSIYPEYLKVGGGHNSGDDGSGDVPSTDITFIVSIVETYDNDASYSEYEQFLEDLFDAMYAVGGGPCMDDHDTDPHVSMARGVKFWSSSHEEQYAYNSNLEVAVWQAMYPSGVVIGSSGYAAFPPGHNSRSQYVGYGNLYFFFDRANITKAFSPYRELTDDEAYYATLTDQTDISSYYSSTTSISFDYGGSGDGGSSYEHNSYAWHADMAFHDMTDGWDLPPNCLQEGETFFGIPLARTSSSKLQSTTTFQEQFDFEYLVDRNNTYISSFGTNHGWLVGEEIGNSVGSIVDKDTAHIPIFYAGTTNANLGGMALSNLIKVANNVDFGKLYIKPAFVYVDGNGHVKLQFEADPSSALAYLYDSLCKELGISWNYDSPSNNLGVYSNCAMHSAGDRGSYGCTPDNIASGTVGGFCPQMTIAYSPRFQSEDYAASYLARCNNYVDYWRSLYPSGVAVGTNNFCPDGGCLGLFLNRYDLYEVFKPDLGGSWVEYNGASMPPTFSPAPTWKGGCDEPHNFHLDKCFRKRYKPKASAVAWDALGSVGQFSVMLVIFMAITLFTSIFLSRARRKKRRGESYLGFFFRDLDRKRRKRGRRKKKGGDKSEALLDARSGRISRHRSKSKSRTDKSKTSRQSKNRGRSTKSARGMKVQPSGDTGSLVPGLSGANVGNMDMRFTQPQDDDIDHRHQLV